MNDRREQDFIRIVVIVAIIGAVILALGLISVFGPVHGGFGPMDLGPGQP